MRISILWSQHMENVPSSIHFTYFLQVYVPPGSSADEEAESGERPSRDSSLILSMKTLSECSERNYACLQAKFQQLVCSGGKILNPGQFYFSCQHDAIFLLALPSLSQECWWNHGLDRAGNGVEVPGYAAELRALSINAKRQGRFNYRISCRRNTAPLVFRIIQAASHLRYFWNCKQVGDARASFCISISK